MTQDDIIRMARDAGFSVRHIAEPPTPYDHVSGYGDTLERFAALIADAKQEQIARQWDALHEQYMADPLRRQMMLSYEMVAKMIRGCGG